MKTFYTILIILLAESVFAQYDPNYRYEEPESPFNVGLGIGVDYGGIGVKFTGLPIKQFGLFAGVGYNFVKAGYNLGALFRVLPDKKVCPYITGMYGYNGVIVVQGATQFNEVYYGPTFGGGIELHFTRKQNFMNFGLLFPLRDQEFYDDVNALKNNPAVSGVTDPLPFSISVGYHFRLNYR